MDEKRLENANNLWTGGRNEDAAREFQAMAKEEAGYPDGVAALLISAHKCYCQIGQFDKAEELMREIRGLSVQDKFVRMIIHIGDACMTAHVGKLGEAVLKFENVLNTNLRRVAGS